MVDPAFHHHLFRTQISLNRYHSTTNTSTMTATSLKLILEIHLLPYIQFRLTMTSILTLNSSKFLKRDTTLLDFIKVLHLEVRIEFLIRRHQQCKIHHIIRHTIMETRISEGTLLQPSTSLAQLLSLNKKLKTTTISKHLNPKTNTIMVSNMLHNNKTDCPTFHKFILSLRKYSSKSIKEKKDDLSTNLDLLRKTKTENLSQQKYPNLSLLMNLNQ